MTRLFVGVLFLSSLVAHAENRHPWASHPVFFTALGKTVEGAFKRTDCVAPFARVPLISEVKGTIAGVEYLDLYTALTLEQPVTVGKKTVRAVTYRMKQKLSNGATSERRDTLSADVPGGLVRREWKKGATYELSDELIDFGAK